jgi:hypothetical protein
MHRNRSRFGRRTFSFSRNALGLLASAFSLAFGWIGLPRESSAANLELVSSFVPGYLTSTNTTDMPTADFDGDGLADIVVPGSVNYSDVMQIVGVTPGQGWKIKQAIIPEFSFYYDSPNLAAWTDADGAHLLYTRGDSFSEYSGWPLTLVRQVQIGSNEQLSDARVADVDNDGVFELIATSNYTNQAVRAYSLTSGALLWEVPNPATYNASLHVAQLDADPALEIVITGIPGAIIDGATHAIEWQYKDGLGPFVEHGRFGGSTPRFASLGYRLTMFQSQPWSPLWDLDNLNARSSAVADVDNDQIDELIVASDNFPYSIQIMDVVSQTTRASFPEDNAVQVATADFDGDPDKEIAIGKNSYYYQAPASNLRVINATTGAEEYAIPTLAPGPYMAGGFIANGNTMDLVFGSGSGSNSPGTITRMDSGNGAIRWRTAANDQTLNLVRTRNIQVTSMAGHSQPVVLAAGAGNTYSYNQIVALNSSDGSVLWTINSTNSALPDNVSINGMAAVDLDGDALADSILACTSEPRLRLFSAADRSQIWSSVAMAGDCRGVMQLSGNGSTQLVAVLSNGLRAYDSQTHLLSWSLPFANGLTAATNLAQGVAGPELALLSDYSTIVFYNAETRGFLRELDYQDLYPVQALIQPTGASIHDLVVSMNGKLFVVDGASGARSAGTAALGFNTGQFNQLATYNDADGSVLIGAGSEVAVATYRLNGLSDAIFTNGFESGSP